MKFWSATVFDTEIQKERYFNIAVPNSLTTKRIREILQEVHEEYHSIRLKRIKKPKNWKVFVG